MFNNHQKIIPEDFSSWIKLFAIKAVLPVIKWTIEFTLQNKKIYSIIAEPVLRSRDFLVDYGSQLQKSLQVWLSPQNGL